VKKRITAEKRKSEPLDTENTESEKIKPQRLRGTEKGFFVFS
jgi:hypothetical protein